MNEHTMTLFQFRRHGQMGSPPLKKCYSTECAGAIQHYDTDANCRALRRAANRVDFGMTFSRLLVLCSGSEIGAVRTVEGTTARSMSL